MLFLYERYKLNIFEGAEYMSLMFSLWSKKTGEIKRFLDNYYEKNINMDDDVDQWIYIYNKPLEAIDIISAVIDNNDKYNLSLCIQLDQGDVYPVTAENYNDVIKGLLCLFYKEENDIAECEMCPV